MIRRLLFVVAILTSFAIHAYSQDGPPTEAPPLPKDGKHKGLQIDRSTVLKGLKDKDSTLIFKPEKAINKMPVLVAHGTANSTVDVVGTEYNLREVKYKVFIIPGNRPSITAEFEKLGYMVGTIIPREELSQWLFGKYKNIVLYPEKEIKESFSDRGTVLDLVYSPGLKCIVFTIRPE